jgi:glycosyltransferase involved in cell wall biosynthesis
MTKTILWANEMSGLSTGYAIYGREVMKRLHATGKYKLFELASYGDIVDKRFTFPWGYYGNNVDPRNEEERKLYNSDPTSAFGKFRFNDVVLDCQPDVVLDVRDHWMFAHEGKSPLRKFFHWGIMPTVDAEPQDEPWMADFSTADSVCTYSDFGRKVLKRDGGGKIPLFKTTPPGVDINVFKPVRNKKKHREDVGFSNDLFIIGTVMRNQKRKLYPDLMEAFVEYLKYCRESGLDDLADKSYLYLHTSYPDVGWDIPRLIKDFGIGSKVLFTYRCTACGHVFPGYFQDAVTTCKNCGKNKAGLPTTKLGVTDEALAQIYNLFDVYVQYANSEGFGMPQVEAAACGIPVFATDYSAMSDVVRKLKGFPIDVQRFFYESETHCKRALPDNTDFVRKLVKFAINPLALQQKRANEARAAVEIHYTWDRTAKLWEELLDSIPARDPNRWNMKPNIFHYPKDRIRGLDNESFVLWCYNNVLGTPEKVGDYNYMKAIKDLNYEAVLIGRGGTLINDTSTFGLDPRWVDFDQDVCFRYFCNMRDEINYWEAKRGGLVQEQIPQYIKFARNPYV